jgi:hypothetical protein
VVQSYTKAILLGTAKIDETLPRLLTVWFDASDADKMPSAVFLRANPEAQETYHMSIQCMHDALSYLTEHISAKIVS